MVIDKIPQKMVEDTTFVKHLTTYSGNIQTALTALGTTFRYTLFINTVPTALVANVVVPENVTLEWYDGNVLDLNGFSFTDNGTFNAGSYQCFDISGGGTLAGNPKLSGPANVLWACSNNLGTSNSAAAFTAILNISDRIYVPSGAYDIAGLTATGSSVENPKIIEGDGPGATILTGNGDLITSGGSLWLSNLSIQNATTEGKLLNFGTGVPINTCQFDNVYFGKATYHIYADRLVVAWFWKNCRFKSASVISRYFKSIWASGEDNITAWFNAVAFEAHGGLTWTSRGSTYEQNTSEAIKLICSDSTTEIINWNWYGTHFEVNGIATTNHVLLETNTDASARVSDINFYGTTFQNPVTKTVPNVGLVKTTGSISRLSFEGYYVSNGQLVTNLSGAYIRVGMGRSDVAISGLNYHQATRQIIQGVLAGNGVEQVTKTINTSETHIVTISTLATGTGASGSNQSFAVTKRPDGTLSATTIFDSGSSYGCAIDITTPSAGDYAVDNKGALPSNFQPRIVIDIL